MKTVKKLMHKILGILASKIVKITESNENEMMILGRIASNQIHLQKDRIIENIQNAEFKVFSQFGDDGIIQFLVDYLSIQDKTFIEFGVGDYRESNTRFLMTNNNWKGLVMDSSKENLNKILNSEYYWKYDLTAKELFVDQDNINNFIKKSGFAGKLGILHIDIDGIDYWIWKKINVIDPIVVIMEYNSVFGPENPWVVPYDKNFNRTSAHYSNLYWGSSISSLCDLADQKGYSFIGTNSAGNNAYFVKKERRKELKPLTAKDGYTLSKYRESRDLKGELNYVSDKHRLITIKGCEVYNTRTNQKEKI